MISEDDFELEKRLCCAVLDCNSFLLFSFHGSRLTFHRLSKFSWSFLRFPTFIVAQLFATFATFATFSTSSTFPTFVRFLHLPHFLHFSILIAWGGNVAFPNANQTSTKAKQRIRVLKQRMIFRIKKEKTSRVSDYHRKRKQVWRDGDGSNQFPY